MTIPSKRARDIRQSVYKVQPWWRDGSPSPRRFKLTTHARTRMDLRAISQEAIDATLTYGRVCRRQNATLYVLSRREVDWLYGQGLDLAKYEGTRVVCSGRAILTVYRARNA